MPAPSNAAPTASNCVIGNHMPSRSQIIRAKHQILLDDRVRMHAYRAAINATVRPGDIVADLGCGLGALSLMACDAGAARVHAIEVEPTTLALAQQTLAASPHRDKIQLHAGLAQTLKAPEQVDVIISETFGSFGLDENTLPLLRAAKSRWLKPCGRMIPAGLTLHLAPVAFRTHSRSLQHRPEALPQSTWLGVPVDSPSLDFTAARRNDWQWRALLDCNRAGTLAGFGVWFTAQLAPNITLATGPDQPATHWQQGFLPIETPLPVQASTQIDLRLRIGPDSAQLETIIEYGFDLR